DEIGRAGRYTKVDQWRASYCVGLDLSTDASVGDCPSSFVPPPCSSSSSPRTSLQLLSPGS
ncbi:Hypothetical predicted protein, partial [Scomber scombrus]